MRLTLIFSIATLALAVGDAHATQMAASGPASAMPCAQINAQIAANKAQAAHARYAAGQLSRIGSTDPSVRVAIARDRRTADDLDKQDTALQQQLGSCTAS